MRISIFLIWICLGLVGCDSAPANPPAEAPESPSLVAMRQAVVNQAAVTIQATYGEFDTAAKALQTATQDWVDAPSDTTRDVVRLRFLEAASVWQRAEVMIVGPAGVMGAVAGGLDLRDKIYSWPLTNPCRVDQELASLGYENDPLDSKTINVFGLDAFEYLAFNDATTNACPINSAINADGIWAALATDEIAARRRAYALAVAKLLVSDTAALATHWEADAAFRTAFETPTSADAYANTREVLNALTDALFYLEKDVKDMKVGRPLGVVDCPTATCPDARESRYANRSLAHIGENLKGFELLFNGGAGPGFDDLLTEVGALSTRDEILADLAAAQAKIASFTVEMDEALLRDLPGIQELYDLLRNLSTLLKTEFITVLDLDLPKRAEGDND